MPLSLQKDAIFKFIEYAQDNVTTHNKILTSPGNYVKNIKHLDRVSLPYYWYSMTGVILLTKQNTEM